MRGGATRSGIAEHDPVRAEPADQLDEQIGQDVGETGDVVAGVHDDENVRVAGPPLPGVHKLGDHLAECGSKADGMGAGMRWVVMVERMRKKHPLWAVSGP